MSRNKNNNEVEDAIEFKDTISSLTDSSISSYAPKVEDIIFGSYVKKDRLTQIVYDTFSGTSISEATELNIFIDLYSVLHQIFSSKYRTVISSSTSITTGLINMCAHYRSFFRTLGVKTKFYLIYSNNTCDVNEKFVYKYNCQFKEKSKIPMFKKIVEENFSLLNLLCPYLPDIFFVSSVRNYEVSVIIAYIIRRLNDGLPNLIISRDMYPMQLCTMFPYTSMLYPYKTKGHDISMMIPLTEKSNHRQIFWDVVAAKRKVQVNKLYDISPINFSLFGAMTRFPERYLLPVVNVDTARKIIDSIVGKEDIRITIQQLYSNPKIMSILPVSIIVSRYKALDVEFMLAYYEADIESKELKFENLHDDGTMNLINAKYFANNPIDLINL